MKLPMNYEKANPAERRKVREAYILLQKGKCHHCDGVLTEAPPLEVIRKIIDWTLFPPHFLTHPVHLHHSHDDGMTIGAVHAYCNAVLWQYYGE